MLDVMSRAEIEKVRGRSRASASGPWVTDFVEMAKKTVLRRLAKLAPMSVEDQRLVTADELADAGRAQQEVFAATDLGPAPVTDVDDSAERPAMPSLAQQASEGDAATDDNGWGGMPPATAENTRPV